jgi:hypothetical protein
MSPRFQGKNFQKNLDLVAKIEEIAREKKCAAAQKARGVTIRMLLTNHSWALEFQVQDPDGNVIRFGSEPK